MKGDKANLAELELKLDGEQREKLKEDQSFPEEFGLHLDVYNPVSLALVTPDYKTLAHAIQSSRHNLFEAFLRDLTLEGKDDTKLPSESFFFHFAS